MAIVELVYLVDRLEGQPQAAQLQRVLKMTVRETGTVEQLWAAMRNAIALHRESLQGEARWYFRAGVIVPGIMLNTYAGDAPRLRAELYDLQQLVQDAPRGMPAAVLAPMRQLAKYAAQATYSQDDLVAIASISGNIMKALES
jgi:hypothetical protein